MNGMHKIKKRLLYDIVTPFGYLEFGYNKNALPIIIDYINNSNFSLENVVIRTGRYAVSDFCILPKRKNFYESNKLKNFGVERSGFFEIKNNDLEKDINIILIDFGVNENLDFFLKENSFDSLFSKSIKKILKETENTYLIFIEPPFVYKTETNSLHDFLNEMSKNFNNKNKKIIWFTTDKINDFNNQILPYRIINYTNIEDLVTIIFDSDELY